MSSEQEGLRTSILVHGRMGMMTCIADVRSDLQAESSLCLFKSLLNGGRGHIVAAAPQAAQLVIYNIIITNLLFSVSLQDINMRKPFKSSVIKEQQVISKSSRPQSVMLMYQHCCEPPPALHVLNPYRFVACTYILGLCPLLFGGLVTI